MRTVVFVLFVLLVAVAAEWIAEDPRFPVTPFGLIDNGVAPMLATAGVALVVSAAVGYALSPGRRRGVRLACALMVVLAALGGTTVGDRVSTNAFNGCIDASAQVQMSIAQFHVTHRRYPTSLSELPIALPCRTPLRGTILRYRTTPEGYSLCFGDWLVAWCGDQSTALIAHK